MAKLAVVFVTCAAVLLTVGYASSCGGTSREIVARVGNAEITKDTLGHWTSIEAALGHQEDPASSGTLTQRTLGFLISAYRTLEEAAEKQIELSKRETREALELPQNVRAYGATALPGDVELQHLLAGGKTTRSDQRWLARVHMLAEKIGRRQQLEAMRRITDAQVARYYASNRRRFVVPELRNVEVIETFKRPAIEKAKREIESGSKLADVVRRRNEEPDVGGLKFHLSRRTLRHPYEENYFKAKAHVLVGPLHDELYYLFEVTAIVPARQQPSAEVQVKIRRQLLAGPLRGVLTDSVRALDESWRARTRCRAGYVAAGQCGGPLS